MLKVCYVTLVGVTAVSGRSEGYPLVPTFHGSQSSPLGQTQMELQGDLLSYLLGWAELLLRHIGTARLSVWFS